MRKLLAFLLPTLLFAVCDPCCYPGTFVAGVDVLYYKPTMCPWRFVRAESADGLANNFRYPSLKPDYDWGVRVFGGYTQGCFFAQMGYQWMRSKDTVRAVRTSQEIGGFGFVIGELLIPGANAGWNSATARLKLTYQNVDLQIGQSVIRKGGCDWQVFGSIRWVYLEETRQLRGEGFESPSNTNPVTGKFDSISRFNGAGLGVGTRGDFNICGNLDAFGELNLMAIIGDRHLRKRRVVEFDGEVFNFNYNSHTCIVPGSDLRIGLRFSMYACNATLVGELGYELEYYLNALEGDRTSFIDITTTTDGRFAGGSEPACRDVGFAGPYAGLRFLF